MKFAVWMVGCAILAAAILTILVGLADFSVRNEIWLGMAGPTLAEGVSWIIMVRKRTRSPQELTKFLVQAFAAKLLFFAAYIAVMLKGDLVQLKPFIACFTGFYVALHLTVAFWLQRTQIAGNNKRQ